MATVNLKNITGEALYLGRPDGRRIEADEVIHVEGTVAKSSPEDAYVIGTGDDARAYPKSTWKVTSEKSKSEPDVLAPSKENI